MHLNSGRRRDRNIESSRFGHLILAMYSVNMEIYTHVPTYYTHANTWKHTLAHTDVHTRPQMHCPCTGHRRHIHPARCPAHCAFGPRHAALILHHRMFQNYSRTTSCLSSVSVMRVLSQLTWPHVLLFVLGGERGAEETDPLLCTCSRSVSVLLRVCPQKAARSPCWQVSHQSWAGVTREKEHWGREEGGSHTDPGGQAGGHQLWAGI